MKVKESNDEIARRFEEARDREEELENLTPVQVRRPRRAESIYSLRLKSEEMKLISSAAQAAGVKLSEFIRAAAVDRANGRGVGQAAADTSSVIGKLIEMNEQLLQANRDLMNLMTQALASLQTQRTGAFTLRPSVQADAGMMVMAPTGRGTIVFDNTLQSMGLGEIQNSYYSPAAFGLSTFVERAYDA